MLALAKAIQITAGGVALATGLTLGIAYGVLIAVINDGVAAEVDV